MILTEGKVLNSEAGRGSKEVPHLTRVRALEFQGWEQKGTLFPKKANKEQSKEEGNWDACLIQEKKQGLPAWSKGYVCAVQMQRVYTRPPQSV